MTDDIERYHKDAIIIANASTFRHSAKVTYLQMVHIILGFAHGASITSCSQIAKTHRDTVRDTYAAFRERLSSPRFEKWIQSAYASPQLSPEDDAELIDEARVALFGCHENTDCLKRFRAGRRKTRVCRACPIKGYVRRYEGGDEEVDALVEIIDNVRSFYQLLGWKESGGADGDARAIFEQRFRHYEVFSTAVGNSEFDDAGKVISDEDDFLSIPHFAKEFTEELKSKPLKVA